MEPRSVFADLDATELETLLRLRPDLLGRTPPASLADLARRASQPDSIHWALEQCNRFELDVLQALALLPAVTHREALVGLLDVAAHADALEGALGTLRIKGLLGCGGTTLSLIDGLGERIAFPARLGRPIHDCLRERSGPIVSHVATNLRLGAVTSRASRAQQLRDIAGAFSDVAFVRKVITSLGDDVEPLLRAVDDRGPLVVVPYEAQWEGYTTPRGPIGRAMSRGLLVSVDWHQVELPREVALALRDSKVFPSVTPDPPAVRGQAISSDARERSAAHTALATLTAIATIAEDWANSPPSALKDGGVGRQALRRAARLIDQEERETARLIDLAYTAHLLDTDDTGTLLPTPDYDRWVAAPLAQRWSTLVTAWVDARRLPSRAGSLSERGKPSAPLLFAADLQAPGLRQEVLGALVSLPPELTPQGDGLAERLVWERPLLWARCETLPQQFVAWTLEEAEVLGVTGSGALSAPGRALLDVEGEDGRVALASAAQMLGEEVATVTLQADLTAMGAGAVSPPVAAVLSLLADIESRGAATVWRFSPTSVRRGFDAGWDLEELERFLLQHAARGVPQPLHYLLSDVSRRYGQVRIGPSVSYVVSDEAALITEVVRSRRLARAGFRLLAPTVAVSTLDPGKLTDLLRTAGFMPAQEDEAGIRLKGADHRRRAPVSEAFPLATARGREAKRPTRDRGKEIARVADRLANRSTGGEQKQEQ